jgi:hypothetical protein
LDCWHHSGLWDQMVPVEQMHERKVHVAYAEALMQCIAETKALIRSSN